MSLISASLVWLCVVNLRPIVQKQKENVFQQTTEEQQTQISFNEQVFCSAAICGMKHQTILSRTILAYEYL